MLDADPPLAISYHDQYAAHSAKHGNSKKPRLKKALFDFFNSGHASWFSARAIDLHFWMWKHTHTQASFADYYAGSIALSLSRGRSHKTLGDKRFLSGTIASGADRIEGHEFQLRGLRYFELAVRHGLRPSHRCVDYGCGSLRIGQHLISYLDPGQYWGLDIVSDFFMAGRPLLPAGAEQQKQPIFHIINPDSLALAAKACPDFILSFAVLKHVAPSEIDIYFTHLLSLMGREARALITFNASRRSRRTGAKIWDYCEEDLAVSVRRLCADAECSFHSVKVDTGAIRESRHRALLISFPRSD